MAQAALLDGKEQKLPKWLSFAFSQISWRSPRAGQLECVFESYLKRNSSVSKVLYAEPKESIKTKQSMKNQDGGKPKNRPTKSQVSRRVQSPRIQMTSLKDARGLASNVGSKERAPAPHQTRLHPLPSFVLGSSGSVWTPGGGRAHFKICNQIGGSSQ